MLKKYVSFLLICGVVGACVVPKKRLDEKQAALDEVVAQKAQVDSELESSKETIHALNGEVQTLSGQLKSAQEEYASQEEQMNATLDEINQKQSKCRSSSPNFGPYSWYKTDPVYRKWRSKTDISIKDVGKSYKDPAMVNRLLRAYHQEFPTVTKLSTIGVTHLGREILALNITNFEVADTKKPAVFLNGAHHGHELLSVEYAFDAINEILTRWKRGEKEAKSWVNRLDIWVVPVVNPDGLWLTTHLHHGKGGERLGGRKNGRNAPSLCATPKLRIGVDLNRNYPYGWGEEGSSGSPTSWKYRGPSAGSEPETKAIMGLAREQHFVASITYHTVGPMVLTPYTLGGRMNPDPDVAWAVAEIFAPTGFPVKSSMYPVSGTDQDWLYHEFGTLAYIFEGSRHNPVEEKKRQRAVLKARPAFGKLFSHILSGPRLQGFVKNRAGKPVRAIIEVAGYDTYNEERWTTRSDGRFDRMLIEPGELEVTATSLNGKKKKTVSVKSGASPITIILDAVSH